MEVPLRESSFEIKKEDIDFYTDDQLRSYFVHYWKNTKSAFAKSYCVNQGNFSLWTNSKRSSPQSSEAVRKYLKELCDFNGTTNISYSPPNAVSPASLIERIQSLTKFKNIKGIVFVDIDNMFSWFINQTLPERDDIHFVVLLSLKSICIEKRNELLSKPNCSVVRTKTGEKNAADVLFTILVTHLHGQLSSNVSFILISRDGFIKEVEEALTKLTSVKRRISSGKPEMMYDLLS